MYSKNRVMVQHNGMEMRRRHFTMCKCGHSLLFWLTAFVAYIIPTLLHLKFQPNRISYSAFVATQIVTPSYIALMESREDILRRFRKTKDGSGVLQIFNFSNAVTLEGLRRQMRQLCVKIHPDRCKQPDNKTRATHAVQVLSRALKLVKYWVIYAGCVKRKNDTTTCRPSDDVIVLD